MEWLLPLLGGLGAGTLITKITDHFLTRKSVGRDLQYKEKREAYLGLLEALHKAAVAPSSEASKNFALWQTRVQLFGSPACAVAVQGIIDTNDDLKELRNKYFNDLIQAMRVDLNLGEITTSK